MWEITLYGKPCDIGYFLELKDCLKSQMNNNCIVVIAFEKELICSIAIVDNKYKRITIKSIYKTIIKIAKSEFYSNNLKIFCDDRSLNSFVLSSILLINLADEIRFAKSITRLTNKVNIRSFVYFKLHKLFDVWTREISYYNANFSGENKEYLYLEFLRFIAQNTNNKLEIAYLEAADQEMLLLDKKKNKLRKISQYDEIGIIASLIMFAPKKIIINCLDKLSNKVADLITYIFEDRVSVLL